MDLSQIDAKHAIQRGPDIEGGCVDLLGLDAWLGWLSDWSCSFGVQCTDQDFELAITVEHLCLISVVELQRLSQREDMFVAVIATSAARIVSIDEWQRTSR